jgi:hypothetical protein
VQLAEHKPAAFGVTRCPYIGHCDAQTAGFSCDFCEWFYEFPEEISVVA